MSNSIETSNESIRELQYGLLLTNLKIIPEYIMSLPADRLNAYIQELKRDMVFQIFQAYPEVFVFERLVFKQTGNELRLTVHIKFER